jgi:hypothetical protein
MLLPVLLLLGAQGMRLVGHYASSVIGHWSLVKNKGPMTNDEGPVLSYLSLILPLIVLVLIFLLTKPHLDALLANTGDDYATAFAYVRDHWKVGDALLTGTPAAAALYLGHNDFYAVQRQGGYDYRLLTLDGQAVDRWLGSPAIRTEAALQHTLAGQRVWLVLERWGLQREYYDLPFQQQLLAQTDEVAEVGAQGIFVLRSKAHPRSLALTPAHRVEATLGQEVQLLGYTVEPEQPQAGQTLRLTLYWQALAPLPRDYTAFVHLRQPTGGNVAQADHRPLGTIYPTTLWPVGETIRESSDLSLPPDLSPGPYQLWTGLYLLETGQRLPLENDPSGENAIQLGQIVVE